MTIENNVCRIRSFLSRRELLRRSACGFGSLALAALLADEAAGDGQPNPHAERRRSSRRDRNDRIRQTLLSMVMVVSPMNRW